MKRDLVFFTGIFALALLAGCKTANVGFFKDPPPKSAGRAVTGNFKPVTVTNEATSGLLQPPSEHFTLGPGDRLEIEIVGDVTTLTAAAVGPDGKIYFNILPGLDVWGLTIPETKALIEKDMAQFVRQPPPVRVTLRGVESRRVWLLGRLNAPGIYPMAAPMTLLEALTVAGGPMTPTTLASSGSGTMGVNFSEDIADLHRSFVIRSGQVLPVDFYRLLKEGDMTQNIYLQPDDF